jgi:ABC-type polysaccharide/polyol phosphate export permease
MASDDLKDIIDGFRKIRTAIWLAGEDMRTRYTRTALGPWWGVLSNVVFVGALGLTFGAIFGQPMQTYLPYIAASMACWTFLNGTVVEAPSSFVRGAGIVTSYPIPLSTMVIRTVADKFALFGHFIAVYAVLAVWLKVPVTILSFLMIFPALLIYAVAGYGFTLGFGMLGARYRDIGPALSSVMMLAFLITPVFWQKVGMRSETHWLIDFNPFYHLIEIGRAPLLGYHASLTSWLVSMSVAVVVLSFGFLIFASMRRKIYYWM